MAEEWQRLIGSARILQVLCGLAVFGTTPALAGSRGGAGVGQCNCGQASIDFVIIIPEQLRIVYRPGGSDRPGPGHLAALSGRLPVLVLPGPGGGRLFAAGNVGAVTAVQHVWAHRGGTVLVRYGFAVP